MRFNWNLYAPNKESSPIRVVVNHHGKTYCKAIGITVPTKHWKIPKRGAQYCTDPKIAEKVRKIDLYLQTNLDDFSTDADVKRVLSGITGGRAELPAAAPKTSVSFWDFWDEYANGKNSKQQNVSINRVVGRLMGRQDDWQDLNIDWFYRLIDRLNDKGYSENYVAAILRCLKACLQCALDKGLHDNRDFQKIKKQSIPADSVYLNEEEIERLWSLELDNKVERRVRDLFLLGFYCAARFSDYSQLDTSMIRDGIIHLTSRKTGVESLIPCAPRVREILERNGGKAPHVATQVMNHRIKDICQKAGIDQPTTVSVVRGGRRMKEVHPKYELVSSHTARRSAATQMVLSGLPERSVMLITGHKTHVAFSTYVRLTKEENAAILKDNPFFK